MTLKMTTYMRYKKPYTASPAVTGCIMWQQKVKVVILVLLTYLLINVQNISLYTC